MLYRVCAKTVFIPEDCRLSLFRGFHLITSLMPYELASCASLVGSKTLFLAKGVMFSMPSRDGCLNACLWTGKGACGAFKSASEVCKSTIRLPRKARRSLKGRRP